MIDILPSTSTAHLRVVATSHKLSQSAGSGMPIVRPWLSPTGEVFGSCVKRGPYGMTKLLVERRNVSSFAPKYAPTRYGMPWYCTREAPQHFVSCNGTLICSLAPLDGGCGSTLAYWLADRSGQLERDGFLHSEEFRGETTGGGSQTDVSLHPTLMLYDDGTN